MIAFFVVASSFIIYYNFNNLKEEKKSNAEVLH